jgi:uncharacterized protein YqgC (DUF456 family)
MNILSLILALILMFIGLLGAVLPVIPGIPLIYAGYLLYGLLTGWQSFGLGTMVLWAVVTALSLVLDYFAGIAGTKKYGATVFGIWGSVVGAVIGVLLANLPGLVIGTFLGAYAGELWAGKTSGEALKAGKGALLGLLGGTIVKVIIGVVMIGTFLWQVFGSRV